MIHRLFDQINDLQTFRGGIGCMMTDKNKLDQLGGRILRGAGLNFEEPKNYNWLIQSRYGGYAHFYIYHSRNDSKRTNEADVSIHRRLIDIDSELGTKASLQLYLCLSSTTRFDIIMVRFSLSFRLESGESDVGDLKGCW